MTASGADRIDHFGAQFIGKLAELFFFETAQRIGRCSRIKQREGWSFAHRMRFTLENQYCR